MSPGREYAVAVGLCLVGAAILLISAGRPWAQAVVEVAPGLPRTDVSLSGRDLVPAVPAAGLVGLAGIAAVVATRGRARVVVGVLLVLAAVLGFVASVRAAGESVPAAAVADRAVVPAGAEVAISGSAWPWLTCVGAIVLLLGGLLVAVRGPRWPGLSRRYAGPVPQARPVAETYPDRGPVPHRMRASGRFAAEKSAPGVHAVSDRPAVAAGDEAVRSRAAEDETEFWDALDRGEDPTARE